LVNLQLLIAGFDSTNFIPPPEYPAEQFSNTQFSIAGLLSRRRALPFMSRAVIKSAIADGDNFFLYIRHKKSAPVKVLRIERMFARRNDVLKRFPGPSFIKRNLHSLKTLILVSVGSSTIFFHFW